MAEFYHNIVINSNDVGSFTFYIIAFCHFLGFTTDQSQTDMFGVIVKNAQSR